MEKDFEKTERKDQLDKKSPLKEGQLWRIKGIGKSIERYLFEAKITTFEQLASLSTEEIADVLKGTIGNTPDKIDQKNWQAQARLFADQLRKMNGPRDPERIDRQYIESFVLELLLDEDRHARRTTIKRLKNGHSEFWAEWDPARVTTWVAEQASIHDPSHPTIEKHHADESAETQDKEIEHKHNTSTHYPPEIFEMSLLDFQDITNNWSSRLFYAGEPFQICVTLDLSHTHLPHGIPLHYHATAEARNVRTEEWIRLGKANGDLQQHNQPVVIIPAICNKTGTYKIDVVVNIFSSWPHNKDHEEMRGFTESKLMQIAAPI